MERLSNDINEVINKANEEICLAFNKCDFNLLVSFTKLPYFGNVPFSLGIFRKDNDIKVKLKYWDTAFDFERWKLGVFNLDRLRIIHSEMPLNNKETAKFSEIFSVITESILSLNLNNTSGITLDPSTYILRINKFDKTYSFQWKSANENIEYYAPLIDFILSVKSKFSHES